MEFEDDEIIECYYGHAIEPGDDYLEYDGHCFCHSDEDDIDCIGKYLFEHIRGIEKRHIYTALEKREIYEDRMYEEWKDRRLWDE